MLLRYLLCLLGILLALPLLALIALAVTLPVTISGIGYLLACFLAVTGLILAPRGGKFLFLTLTGVLLLVTVAGVRMVLARWSESSKLTVVTLPQGKETRWINTLVDEQDSLVFGEATFHRIGGDSAREHAQIAVALHRSYADLKSIRGVFPSPVISTYLGLQRSDSFDTVIIEPDNMRQPRTAVIFLHGSMGNVTAQCWKIAQGVAKVGTVTVCPSTDWTGQWWRPEGEAILQTTFQYLREQGIENIYLGGFSAGGFGISNLVSELSKEDDLRGLIFIDGIANGASIREAGLPVLIIQAAQDERVPVEGVRQIAKVIGDLGTYVELEGDHFIIMKQPELVQNAVADWLEKQSVKK